MARVAVVSKISHKNSIPKNNMSNYILNTKAIEFLKTLLGPDGVGCQHHIPRDFLPNYFEQEVQLLTVDLKTACYSRRMNLSNGVNLN
jgi:hypothetical protein